MKIELDDRVTDFFKERVGKEAIERAVNNLILSWINAKSKKEEIEILKRSKEK